jgi:hypothetical protein
VLAAHRYPGLWAYMFGTQQFTRYTSGGFNNAQPWWFYVVAAALLLFPWPLLMLVRQRARTAGQPYLTQLYGQILIDQLNDAERRQASLDDLEPVEREALSKAVNYFQNIWRALRPDAAQALLTLAQGQPLALPSATRRYLQRRLLIGEDDRLSIPLFQRWLLENQLEAAG